jgi:hypothetical protein
VISSSVLRRALDVHGGVDAWSQVERIEARLSSWGLAFSSHMRPRDLLGLGVSMSPHDRRVEFRGYGGPDRIGVWSARRVELRGEDGRLIVGRDDPRKNFSRVSRTAYWDRLDLLYFAGYAVWNYLSFPFVLIESGVVVEENGEADGGKVLTATFPPGFPTHSRQQRFRLDDDGLLLRHDYAAHVISRWATAANICLESATSGPFRFYTRRKVTPRIGAHVLPGPVLVNIEFDRIVAK